MITTHGHNDENNLYLNDKSSQNIPNNQRRPLGNYNFGNVIEVGNSKTAVLPVKGTIVGVQTRSQTARMRQQANVDAAPNNTKSAFEIYEDIDFSGNTDEAKSESMEVIEEKEINDSMMECHEHTAEEYDFENIDEDQDSTDGDDNEADFTFYEESDEDVEMLNVLRKQKSEEDEEYDKKHRLYSLLEYRDDIYKNMRNKEISYLPKRNFITKQPFDRSFRSDIIDLLIYKAKVFNFKRETLFLAVNYFDRFLSIYEVKKSKCEISAYTSLFIAAKYEEVNVPDISDYLSQDGPLNFTKFDLLKFEILMLKALGFMTNVPTANFFCLDLLNKFSLDYTTYALTFYFLELSLIFGDRLTMFVPSLVATTCVFMSILVMEGKNCINRITLATGYVLNDLIPCISSMIVVLQCPEIVNFTGLKNKYLEERYSSVANFALPKGLTLEGFLKGNFN